MSTKGGMPQPNVQAQLSVRNGRAAVDFYKAAFAAVEVYRFGGTDDLEEVVAQLAVGGATVRMLLIVEEPKAVLEQAVAAGATEINPVGEEHGWQLGRIDDPFGHRWEIGKPISEWPPADNHSRSD